MSIFAEKCLHCNLRKLLFVYIQCKSPPGPCQRKLAWKLDVHSLAVGLRKANLGKTKAWNPCRLFHSGQGADKILPTFLLNYSFLHPTWAFPTIFHFSFTTPVKPSSRFGSCRGTSETSCFINGDILEESKDSNHSLNKVPRCSQMYLPYLCATVFYFSPPSFSLAIQK